MKINSWGKVLPVLPAGVRDTPNQSITIRESNGQNKDYDLSGTASATIDPAVKVGSRLKVSETNSGGQRTIRVESATNERAGTNSRQMPRTASDEPLIALIGIGALTMAGAVAFARRRLA